MAFSVILALELISLDLGVLKPESHSLAKSRIYNSIRRIWYQRVINGSFFVNVVAVASKKTETSLDGSEDTSRSSLSGKRLGKLPTYPSPKPTFCPKRKVSVNVGLGEG